MAKIKAFLLAGALMLVPASAFAEVSLSDMLPDEEAFVSEIPAMELDMDLAQPGPRPGYGPGPRPGYGPGPRPGYGPGPRPAPVVRHYRTNVRPRGPIVVVEEPATTVVVEETTTTTTTKKKKKGSRFGLGLRGVGVTNSNIVLTDGAELSSKAAGGIGFYLKYRPIRWISVEFINDYLFGRFCDIGNEIDEYFRVPLSIGLRAHVFDYGSLDVYGAAAASVTFVTLDDGNDHLDQEKRFPQFGAQFGGGISLVAGGFEIGLDLRYTIEEAPDEAPLGLGEVNQDEVIHGFLFSLNVGFAI